MKVIFKTNLRVKLIASLLSVVLIIGIASIILGLRIINNNIVGQAYEQVQNDLKTAEYIYNDKINIIHIFVKHLASLPYIKEAVSNNRYLQQAAGSKKELNLNILNIVDRNGNVIVRAHNPKLYGDVSGVTIS